MNLQKIGVELSYLLRHCKEPLYVDPEGGWAQTETMITVLAKHFPGMNREVLEAVVAADNKGRFSFDDTRSRIRANQGHSIPSVRVDMQRMDPPEFLFHGTSDRFLPAIMEAGLNPMSRQFVHLSSDVETAVKVGKRHGGKTLVLKVHAKALAEAGSEFLLSANGVWQVKAVPPEYLEQMVL